MRVEISHRDDDGHYLALGAQETVTLTHRVSEPMWISRVEVSRPENESLDVLLSAKGGLSARWSGLYLVDPVEIGWKLYPGDFIQIQVKNIGSLATLARIFLDYL